MAKVPLLSPYKMGRFDLSHRQASLLALSNCISKTFLSPFSACGGVSHGIWNSMPTNCLLKCLNQKLSSQDCFSPTDKTEVVWQHASRACHTVLCSESDTWRVSDIWGYRCLGNCTGIHTHSWYMVEGTSWGLEAYCRCGSCQRWGFLLPDLACGEGI